MRNPSHDSTGTVWLRRVLPFLLVFAIGSAGADRLGSSEDKERDRTPSPDHRHKGKHDKGPPGKTKPHKGPHKVKHKKGPPAFELGFNPRTLKSLSPTEIERIVPRRGPK